MIAAASAACCAPTGERQRPQPPPGWGPLRSARPLAGWREAHDAALPSHRRLRSARRLLLRGFSAALVSRDGSVDWACLRRFDSGSCFGRLLDWDRGGCFSLAVRDATEVTRRYLDGTLVLEATVVADGGRRVRILDALAMRPGGTNEQPPHQLLRVVEGVDGEAEVDVHLEPRFDYGELTTVDVIRDGLGTEPHGFLRRFVSDPTEKASSAAFLLCSFWLADVLHMQGQRDEAVALFERLLETANDVGLLSEMVEATTADSSATSRRPSATWR